jgi:eukaryotic-like serine/threonine-protein kinase
VKVPDVVGRDAATAEALLEQAGFTVTEKPAAVFDSHQPEGQVLSQTPTGGTYAKTGSIVTVFVNTKPSPSPTPSSPSPTGSPSTSPSGSPSPTP